MSIFSTQQHRTAVVIVVLLAVIGHAEGAGVRVIEFAGNRLGVVNDATGDTIHVINKPAGVIREMIALDSGAVVMTTRADTTEFWNAASGERIRTLDERIYAFSHRERLCVTFTREHDLVVLDYPELAERFVLLKKNEWGPSALLFSPDDRYLAVEFCNHYPLSDEMFLDPVFDATAYQTRVFDLRTGQQVPKVGGFRLGRFGEDSRVYVTDDGRPFDLRNEEWLPGPQR